LPAYIFNFLMRKHFDVDLAELVKFEAVKWSRAAVTEGERASHFGRKLTFEMKPCLLTWLWVGDVKLTIANLSTWLDIFPPTSCGKRKELLQDPLCHMSTFIHWCFVVWTLFSCFDLFGEQRCFQTESLAWTTRQFDLWFPFSEMLCRIWIIIFIRVETALRIYTGSFYYQCESVRNVKAQLADPAVS
jgi:hypothetical protein